MAPTSPKFTTEKGYLTTEHIDYFRAAARGGAAVITLGNCTVDIENAQDEPRQVAIGSDDYLIGLGVLQRCAGVTARSPPEINHAGLDTNGSTTKFRRSALPRSTCLKS